MKIALLRTLAATEDSHYSELDKEELRHYISAFKILFEDVDIQKNLIARCWFIALINKTGTLYF